MFIKAYLDFVKKQVGIENTVYSNKEIEYYLKCGLSETWQMAFQGHWTLEYMTDLHHDIMYFIMLISSFVLWMIFTTVYTYKLHLYVPEMRWQQYTNYNDSKLLHPQTVPGIFLMVIAILLTALLLEINPVPPEITYRAVGTKWYWTYEYTSLQNRFLGVESFEPLQDTYYYDTTFRLLDVCLTPIPGNIVVRLLMTSSDVLHTVASRGLGILTDTSADFNNTAIIIKDGVLSQIELNSVKVNRGLIPVLAGVTEPIKGHTTFWFWALQPSIGNIAYSRFTGEHYKLLYRIIRLIYIFIQYKRHK